MTLWFRIKCVNVPGLGIELNEELVARRRADG